MNLEALTLLETPTARKLVASWPQVKDYSQSHIEICRKWSQVSGVHYKTAWRWLRPLIANEIIRDDGTIDAVAADYIATCALSRAKFEVDRKRKGQMDS